MGFNEVVKYCEARQNYVNKGKDCEAHNSFLEEIFNKPELAGIRGVDLRYRDVVLSYDKEIIGEIDLVLINSNIGEIYICEIKASRKFKKAINKQLRRGYEFFKNNFGILPFIIFLRKNNGNALERIIMIPDEERVFVSEEIKNNQPLPNNLLQNPFFSS